jgi:hypothetical protein
MPISPVTLAMRHAARIAALCSTLERSAHTSPEQGLGPGEAETRSDTGQ